MKEELKNEYDERGFAVVEKAVPEDVVEELRAEADRFFKSSTARGGARNLLHRSDRLRKESVRQPDLVICVASQDALARRGLERKGADVERGLARLYAEAFEKSRIRPRTAVVVDLVGEGTDAEAIALGIAEVQGHRGTVVVWRTSELAW